MVYEGNAWLGYDRRFRQAAAANPNMQWSKTDTDLWHLAFTGMVKRPRCVHYLSLSHKSSQCHWAQEAPEMPSSPMPGSWYYSQGDLKYQSNGICRSWNRDHAQAVHSRTASSSTFVPTVPGIQPAQTSHTKLCFALLVHEHLAYMLAVVLANSDLLISQELTMHTLS